MHNKELRELFILHQKLLKSVHGARRSLRKTIFAGIFLYNKIPWGGTDENESFKEGIFRDANKVWIPYNLQCGLSKSNLFENKICDVFNSLQKWKSISLKKHQNCANQRSRAAVHCAIQIRIILITDLQIFEKIFTVSPL